MTEIRHLKGRRWKAHQRNDIGRAFIGCCPVYPGGTGISNLQTIVDRFGTGAAARQFYSGLQVPPRPAGLSIVHSSFKPDPDLVISGALDGAIETMAAGVPAGDLVEVWHESDLKERAGTFTFSQLSGCKNRFYDRVKIVNQAALVGNTLTSWQFDDNNDSWDRHRWLRDVKADVLGVDVDGVHSSQLPYPDYMDDLERTKAIFDVYHNVGGMYRYVAIPELGTKIISPTVDPTGAYRRAWADNILAQYAAQLPLLYVAWYDFLVGTTDDRLVGDDIAWWANHVAMGA